MSVELDTSYAAAHGYLRLWTSHEPMKSKTSAQHKSATPEPAGKSEEPAKRTKLCSDKVEGPSEAQSRKMDKLRKSFRDSFRKKKDGGGGGGGHIPESSKPHLWQTDEAGVRDGSCSFVVKYMGCVEVYESRGMQVCEEALKVLRNSRRRPVRGILYVSGDGLRVVDDETKGLLVDQTIEKVSFCAPDRNHERGFSYICRDGTTRRWMCHGFVAVKETGERLSHAVGCAFAACLERKQKRDKECGVTMSFDQVTSSFTRMGSFRHMSVTERLSDPQDCKPIEPVPVKKVSNPHAIARPHATPQLLQRQGSFRVFNHLNQSSPFKRQLSLRPSDLPSNIERTRSLSLDNTFLDDCDDKTSNSHHDSVNNNVNDNGGGGHSNGGHQYSQTIQAFNTEPPLSPSEGGPTSSSTSSSSFSPPGPPRTHRSRLHSLPIAVNMAPIPETSPLTETTSAAAAAAAATSSAAAAAAAAAAKQEQDAVSAMCQQVTAGLSFLSNFPDESEGKGGGGGRPGGPSSSPFMMGGGPSPLSSPLSPPPSLDSVFGPSPPPGLGERGGGGGSRSKGEEWLAQINSQATPHSHSQSQSQSQQEAPLSLVGANRRNPPLSQLRSSSLGAYPSSPSSGVGGAGSPPTSHPPTRGGEAHPPPGHPTFSTSFSPSMMTNGTSPLTGGLSPYGAPPPPGLGPSKPPSVDPFDAGWADFPGGGHNPNPNNPFLQNTMTKAFQVQM